MPFWRLLFEIGQTLARETIRTLIAGPGIKVRMRFDWNMDELSKWDTNRKEAQMFIDNEILRHCGPYTPLRTGFLIKSGTLGTHPGSGVVQWIAPYAKAQYYSARLVGSSTGPLRGPFWFERMKAAHGRQIMEGARRIACKGKE